MENNATRDKSIIAILESEQTMLMDDISKLKCNSNKKINISLDIIELYIYTYIVDYNSSVNNTSCVTVKHGDIYKSYVKFGLTKSVIH